MFGRLFNKRSIVGSVLFMVLVGEPTVGFANGLYTLPGFVALLLLYFCYFHLIDSIVARFRVNRLGLVLINFTLYSVLATGLLHGEIASYIEQPENGLIITLIRIQCSLFPLFAYELLRRVAPANKYRSLPLPIAGSLFLAYVLLLTPTGLFGLSQAAHTISTAPVLSLIFGVLAAFALIIGLKLKASAASNRHFSGFYSWSVILGVLALIPSIPTFMALLLAMIIIGAFYLSRPGFRRSAPS